MEKETKNILIGAGALAALYILFNKYKKDVINKPIVSNKVISNEPVPVVPIETAPVLPSEPVAVIPVRPAPVLPVQPAPFEQLPIFTNPIDDFINPVVPFEPTPFPVEQFPVETAPFEPLPIFTNPIDDFINPIVPFEPTPLPVEQFPFEPAPFEPLPIFTNPIDNFINPIVPFEPSPIEVDKYVTIGNAINDSTALGAFHRDSRIGQIRSYATNIINSDKIKNGSKIRIYKSNDVYILGTVIEYNKSNGLLLYKEEDSVAPTDSALYNGFSIQVLNSIIEPLVPVQPVITAPPIEINTADQFVFNIEPVEPAPVEIFTAPTIKPPLESVMIGTVIGNDINEICASEERTLLFTSLYDWNRASTWSGLTFYEDSELTIPVTNAKYIKKWMDNRNVYEISNGLVGKSLGDCVELIVSPIEINTADQFVFNIVQPQEAASDAAIARTNAAAAAAKAAAETSAAKAAADAAAAKAASDAAIARTNAAAKAATDAAIAKTTAELNAASAAANAAAAAAKADMDAAIASANAAAAFARATAAALRPYTVQGGGGFSAGNSIDEICNSNQDPVVIYFKAFNGIGTYGQLGAKLYKDQALTIPYTDGIYVTRWRARPTQEIMKLDGNGTIIDILSPC